MLRPWMRLSLLRRFTPVTLQRPFEFVVLDAPNLQPAPDQKSFAGHFSASEDVVVFPSLGKDSTLIVPSPRGPAVHYVHLASFLRGAPPTQINALWMHSGSALKQRLGSSPVWLSTAGGGVAWLHVRLDQRPKYYWYGPYRSSVASRERECTASRERERPESFGFRNRCVEEVVIGAFLGLRSLTGLLI